MRAVLVHMISLGTDKDLANTSILKACNKFYNKFLHYYKIESFSKLA